MKPIDQYTIDYEELIKEYKELGTSMIWTMMDRTDIMIKDMQTSHVKNCISMLSRREKNGIRKAWVYILEDVLVRRRTEKIDKIQNNIKCKKQESKIKGI